MTDLAVIMSVYLNDRLEFVKESVNSILGQSFTAFHFYIVFDGPLKQDVDTFLSSLTDDRIRIFRLEENGGLARALNYLLGIVLSEQNYKLIARMDADDISGSERFERQCRFMKDNPGIGCLGSWYEEIDTTGNHLHFRKMPVRHEELRRRYFTRTPFAHPTVMYRKSLIEKAGLYPTDTILMEDNVLWGRALKAGIKFANIPEYLFKFRIDENFYDRRSGIKYGWNFIKIRFGILNEMNAPFNSYILSFFVGFVKMMPSLILRIFHMF
jgi:glycosyltransferase involved in cell wall biosynthesis